jgi:hypothetical protein
LYFRKYIDECDTCRISRPGQGTQKRFRLALLPDVTRGGDLNLYLIDAAAVLSKPMTTAGGPENAGNAVLRAGRRYAGVTARVGRARAARAAHGQRPTEMISMLTLDEKVAKFAAYPAARDLR